MGAPMEWAGAECKFSFSLRIEFDPLTSLRPPQGPAAAMGGYGGYDQGMMQGARGPGAFGPRGGRGARRW
jgi:hypothetical protein